MATLISASGDRTTRRLTGWLVAGVILAGSLISWNLRAQPVGIQEETVKVLVAKKNLDSGTFFKKPEEVFEQKDILKVSAPKDALTKLEELSGRQLKISRREGDTVTLDDLYDGATPIGIGLLPPGHRAVGIRIGAEQIAAGFAAVPGSRLDIVVTARGKDDKDFVSRKILKNVLVLPTSDAITRDESGKRRSTDIVTVALKPDDALELEAARSKGTISLHLSSLGKKTKDGKPDDKKDETDDPNDDVPQLAPRSPSPGDTVGGASPGNKDNKSQLAPPQAGPLQITITASAVRFA